MWRGEPAHVQQKLRQHLRNVRCCVVHQLKLIMQHATSYIPAVSVYFSDLGGILTFFLPSHPNAPEFLTTLLHKGHQELQPQDGTLTVEPSTLCMRI